MNRYIRTYEIKEKPSGDKNTHLKCEVYYKLGGMNYFSYENEPRGYYMSVTPCEIRDGLISFRAFSGYKKVIKTVNRQSKKGFEEAKEKFLDEYMVMVQQCFPYYKLSDEFEEE